MYCPFHVRVWTSFRRYVLLLCQSYKLTINQTQNNRKRTATVPKKCFSYSRPLHNGLNPGETPSYSAYHQDQNMCISHGIKNMVKITTVFHLPKQDRNRTGTENDFNSTRYYEFACFLLQTSKINKLTINIKCP